MSDPKNPSVWSDLKASIRGGTQDFTKGSIGRAVLLLSVPMMLEMVMQSVFGVVDVLFVGRLGSHAVAAVGLTDSLLTLVFAIALGLAMATTAMVARRIGEGDRRAAAGTAFQALALGAGLSIPIGIIGALFGSDLLQLMGAEAATVQEGGTYAAVVLGGSSTVFFLFLINAVFRGTGDASLAMRSLWIANILNIILDPLLIFGIGPFPEMGVTGAGVATTVARGVGVAYQLTLLCRGTGRIRLRRDDITLESRTLRRLARVGTTGAVQYLVATASWLLLMWIMARFGSAALAGYTIAARILVFALLPSWGMANAAATLVGQNLGAGLPDRAERSVWITVGANTLFLGVTAVIMIVFGEALVRPFTNDPEVLRVGADCIRIVSYSYVFFACGMVSVQAFNGAGDTTTPTWINLICYWMFELPLAWWMSQTLGMGPHGVYWAIAAAQVVLAIVGILWFRRGTWKTRLI